MHKKIRVKIGYYGGDADNHRLNVYDAGHSFTGFARTLAIITHAFINQEVKRKASNVRGARIYITPSRKGSFEEWIDIVFSAPTVVGIGGSIIGAALYDFLKHAINNSVGKENLPETAYVKKIEPHISDIDQVLDSALEEFHRPISSNNDMEIRLFQPKGKIIATLDKNTLDYVKVREEGNVVEGIEFYVSRYNVFTRIGRMYNEGEKKVIPFDVDESLDEHDRHLLTWSLNEVNNGREGALICNARKVVTAKGKLRRYILVSVKKNRN